MTELKPLSSEQPISNEQAILNAAEDLFVEKGYAQVSTTAIAKKAGCSQAMVHYYYRSKEKLFGLVFKRKVAPFLASLIEVKQEDLPFEDRLKKRIRAHFDMIHKNERMPLIVFNEVLVNQKLAKNMLEIVKELPNPFIAQLQSELDEEYLNGGIRQTVATDLIFQIVSMNVMAVMINPLIRLYLDASSEYMSQLLEIRKETNVAVILRSLKP
jgi:TetR/AcrR family transcriptional regulator